MNTQPDGVSAMSAEFCEDETALLPCPFCGSEAEIITLQGETDEPSIGAQAVQCKNHACGAASGLVYPLMDDVTHLLRERWNKRQNAGNDGR
jgi:hypothetical protein